MELELEGRRLRRRGRSRRPEFLDDDVLVTNFGRAAVNLKGNFSGARDRRVLLGVIDVEDIVHPKPDAWTLGAMPWPLFRLRLEAYL